MSMNMMLMRMNKYYAKYCLYFFAVVLSWVFLATAAQNTTSTGVNIGVVLDLNTWAGKMELTSIRVALSDFYDSHPHYKTRLVLNPRDSREDVVQAAASALDLIKNVEVQAIIGPEDSMQATFLIDLGNKSKVPIVSFSATRPMLTSHRNPYFFRAATNDSAQVKTISAIVKTFAWRQVVPIYVDDEFGEGLIPYLTDALEEVDARVPYRSVISPKITDDQIAEELYLLMTMQTRVFVVHMSPSLGSRLFTKANEIGMMSKGYVWIMTDGITNDLNFIQPSVYDSMQGVLGVRTYVPRSKILDEFKVRWSRKFRKEYPKIDNPQLDVFCLWAYDATWALALAVEKAGIENFRYVITPNASSINNSSTDLDFLNGINNQNGPKLVDALSNVTFKGVAGDHFSLIDGQLQSSTFQVVNINGQGGRVIGYWTPKTSLVKKLTNSTHYTSTESISRGKLSSIIWPGDSTSAPKGWEIPTNGKKLKIGVPVKDGFSEFVKVTHDHATNMVKVTGYCIDVFAAVIEALPYDITYDLIPFANASGDAAGNYNDLTYQVYLGNFDGVVGDTAILANRSQYVDFALPYTKSGVSMIVPLRSNKKENAWVFLWPLTWDLWMTIGLFFIFTGFAVWILEYRDNPQFQGSWRHQVGTSLGYSFSTMVFAHREATINNWARLVVIVWVFVVLILTQSYTASLASLLTVQQLQPTVTDVNQLLKNGENVGYQEGSFVFDILRSLKFNESKLITYGSPEELHDLFQSGSSKGGISAALDESPYVDLFLSEYCSKYTTTKDPEYKIGGFGFAFPKGSPIVPDISRAVLNVIESEKMKGIESAWFKRKASCLVSDLQPESTSLSFKSFWGLFLVTGTCSLAAIIAHVAAFLHREREALWGKDADVRISIWKRIRKKWIIVQASEPRGVASTNGDPGNSRVHEQQKTTRRARSAVLV